MYTSHSGKVTFKALKKGITTIMIQLINTSNDEVIKTKSFVVYIKDKL